MSFIDTYELTNSAILRIYSEKDELVLDPDYQRNSQIWTEDKKKLLIDSIINEYDIPKLYFHVYEQDEKLKSGFSYSVIDGKQRLETIWDFIENKFTLDKNFEYLKNKEINLSGMSYNDISKKYPKIKIIFDSFVLPIVLVRTDEIDLIEEMFSRLNEAAPLNSAEKRNALGGDFVVSIRKVANHKFFKEKVKFTNKRYQHREIACRLLLTQEKLSKNEKLIDTKKVFLDDITKRYKSGNKKFVNELTKEVIRKLDVMTNIFIDNDKLLSAQGNMVVFYLVFDELIKRNLVTKISRKHFEEFVDKVQDNREIAENEFDKANYELYDYFNMTQQGTNDALSILQRCEIILKYLEI